MTPKNALTSCGPVSANAYENGFRNNKLALLYNINKTAQVGVQTLTEITERIILNNTIMQGTVWRESPMYLYN